MKLDESVQNILENRDKVSSLPNGLDLLVQEDHRFPLVVLRMYVHAGSAYEQDQEAGVSHLLEHMAFRGHGRKSGVPLSQEIEAVGGSLNAATSFDYTVYMIDLPAKNWSLGLDVLYQLCFEISFDDQELELEKQVVLSELEQNQESPKHSLFQSVQSQVWKGSEYERPVIGSRDSVKGINQELISSYLDRLYQPQSMVCVVCGDVQEESVLEYAHNLFGQLQNTSLRKEPPYVDRSYKESSPSIVCKQSPWNSVYMGIGFPLPPFSSPYSEVLEVLAYILGGDKTSKFYNLFQYQEDLVHDIAVVPVFLEREGMFYIQAQMEIEQIKTFWQRFLQIMSDSVLENISQEDIDRAVFNIQDGIFQIKETLPGFASKLGYFLFFEKKLEAEVHYFHQLDHVKQEDLRAVFRQYLRPDLLRGTIFLPKSSSLNSDFFLKELQRIWAHGFQKQPLSIKKSDQKTDQIIDLANNCQLVLLPDKTLPYTAIDMTWRGGDGLLLRSKQGISCLTAKMLVRGTKDRTANEIQRYLSQRASIVEAQATRDQFTIMAKYPIEFESDILELFQGIITAPGFLEGELGKAINEQSAQIIEQGDHPLGLVSRELFPFLFPEHTYGYYALGHTSIIENFNTTDVSDFWQKQRSIPWVLSVCGQFDEYRVQSVASRLTEIVQTDWTEPPPEVVWSDRRDLRLYMADRNQSHVVVVFPIPGLGHDSNAAISLLKMILAGQGGILFQEFRDKYGLGYQVSPILWRTPLTGLIGFYIGTYPDKTQICLDHFQDIISQLKKEPVSPGDLHRAKNLLQIEYSKERQPLLNRSSEASDLLGYQLGLNFYQTMIDKAMSLGNQDVQAVINQYFQWGKAYTLIVSPRSASGSSEKIH